MDNGDIRKAFQQLFESAGVNYILTPDLKSANVTVNLNDIPFRNALAALLLTSPTPVVCRIVYDAQPEDNSILASWTDEQALRQFREIVRLFDVLPRQVAIRAQVVLDLHGKDSYESVFTVEGQTVSGRPLTMETTTDGSTPAGKKVVFSSGTLSVNVKPILNGNETLSLEAECTLDLTYRLPGATTPIHLQNTFNGAGILKSDEAMPLARTALRLGVSRASMTEGELRIFLTPKFASIEEPTPSPLSAPLPGPRPIPLGGGNVRPGGTGSP